MDQAQWLVMFPRTKPGWEGLAACQASMGLAKERVDGLGERGAGLVGGDVEQADRVARQDLPEVACDGGPVVLAADASQPKAGDLVTALAAEQPGQRDRANQLQRIEQPRPVLRKICGRQIQSGPQQLGPDLVRNHAPVWAEQSGDAARGGQRALGVEPPGQTFPLLAVSEEHP
ncbi:hypothetical protein [Streptomyces sp. NPDC058964]|uniref:hypothetical protein n=1 Tax=Streptomyces sp. NPDC058964 TaxID=3346681 RepID=UPI00369C448A